MRNALAKILDDCLGLVEKGESIEACLAKYPDRREELEPLLRTAFTISSIPKVQPAPEFITMSKSQLLNRINREMERTKGVKSGKPALMFDGITAAFHAAWQSFTGAKKVVVPVTVVLFLIISAGLYQFGGFSFLAPTPVKASPATLTILSGSVEIQNPGSDTSQEGYDGMVLSVGVGIKTGPDSHALITFFEGSTAKLEPNTYLEISRLEEGEAQSRTIILKQWMGRTWNRVVKMTDPGSRYEIETPTATAIVRGTLFTTDVGETGFTTVSTTEGLVSVVAQGEEVFVAEDQQTEVEKGTEPSQPAVLPAPKSQLIITVDMPAAGSVIDPTGSSTGILPTGLQFNQIQGSYSSSSAEGTQVITIADPMTGEYIIALRPPAEGSGHFRIEGISGSETVFNYIGNWDAEKESGRLIHLNLEVDNGIIVGNDINLVEPIGDKTEEKIVDTTPDDGEELFIETESQDNDRKGVPAGEGNDAKDVPGGDKPDDEKDNDTKDVPGGDKPKDEKDNDTKDVPGRDKPKDEKDNDTKDAHGKDKKTGANNDKRKNIDQL